MTRDAPTIVALVKDIMDQSRIRTALGDVTFTNDPGETMHAGVVIVDLARFADRVGAVRAATDARIVAFGPHVDDALLDAARAAGADAVLARSTFFRDPGAAISNDRGAR
jgi:hypothetical protein